jgi:hypothetical protein
LDFGRENHLKISRDKKEIDWIDKAAGGSYFLVEERLSSKMS